MEGSLDGGKPGWREAWMEGSLDGGRHLLPHAGKTSSIYGLQCGNIDVIYTDSTPTMERYVLEFTLLLFPPPQSQSIANYIILNWYGRLNVIIS